MAITVYWACLEDEWMLAKEPENILKNFLRKEFYESSFHMAMNHCPAFTDELKNVYGLKSIYNYEFEINENGTYAAKLGQKFYDKHVLIRSLDKKCFSFKQDFIFFTDAPSLEISTGILPFMEDNNINQRCIVFPGKFDIAKRFRPIDFAFYLKKDWNSFRITYDEIFQYIRFHTDEKIVFKQFRFNDKLKDYAQDYMRMNKSTPLKKMMNFYKYSKIKNLVLNEIRNSFVDQA